jgi:serine/threonine protein phosphatase PrpC
MIRSFGISEVGPVRTNNEDCAFSDDSLALYVVADGMGGHAAGEVAAHLAVEAIQDFIRRSQLPDDDITWPHGIDPTLSAAGNRVRTAIQLANRCIYDAAQRQPDYHGMGTTVVCALATATTVTVGHVGDSRLYLLSRGRLIPQTQDDTWMAAMLGEGEPVGVSLADHPMRNVLTNVLGTGDFTEIHISELGLSPGDMLLLSSDGVHGVVDDDTLCELMSQKGTLEEIARSLIAMSVQRGTRDNVTVVVVRYEDR